MFTEQQSNHVLYLGESKSHLAMSQLSVDICQVVVGYGKEESGSLGSLHHLDLLRKAVECALVVSKRQVDKTQTTCRGWGWSNSDPQGAGE